MAVQLNIENARQLLEVVRRFARAIAPDHHIAETTLHGPPTTADCTSTGWEQSCVTYA